MAQRADKVLAMDFMENFILKNKEINGHYGNTEFLQADATKIQLKQDRLVSWFW